MRYFIEQAPNRFYSKGELNSVKARARSLSANMSEGVYVIAEEYDRDLRDYVACGSIAYYGGRQDAKEGCFA